MSETTFYIIISILAITFIAFILAAIKAISISYHRRRLKKSKQTIMKETQEPVGGMKNEWQLCPKCNGQGSVSKPPWVPGDVHQWSSTSVTYPCDVCNGTKIIACLFTTPPASIKTEGEDEKQNIAENIFEEYHELIKKYSLVIVEAEIRQEDGEFFFDTASLKENIAILAGYLPEEMIVEAFEDFDFSDVDKEGCWHIDALLSHQPAQYGDFGMCEMRDYAYIEFKKCFYRCSFEEREREVAEFNELKDTDLFGNKIAPAPPSPVGIDQQVIDALTWALNTLDYHNERELGQDVSIEVQSQEARKALVNFTASLPQSSTEEEKECKCGINELPYDATITIKKCSRCGNNIN